MRTDARAGRDRRFALAAAAFVAYVLAVTVWLTLAISASESAPHLPIERTAYPRIGWPLGPIVAGTVWTALAVAVGYLGLRARPSLAFIGHVAALGSVGWTTLFIAAWARHVSSGISASEFMDAFFLVPGGLVPGGFGTLQPRLAGVLFAALAAYSLARLVVRATVPARARSEGGSR
jgi:hypothetical protein